MTTSDFLVNEKVSSGQYQPAIAALDNGGFSVSWYSDNNASVYGRRFNAKGEPAEIRLVGTDQADDVTWSDAAYNLVIDLGDRIDSLTLSDNADTATLVNVESANLGGGDDVVHVDGANAAYQVDAIELPAEVTAGTTYTVSVDNHTVTYTAQADDTVADVRAGLIGAVNADGTVGAIVAASGGASATELRLQALSSEAGSAFQVNTHTDSSQYDSAMSALANGRFITTWTSQNQDDSGTGIYGQISDAKGTPIGGEF